MTERKIYEEKLLIALAVLTAFFTNPLSADCNHLPHWLAYYGTTSNLSDFNPYNPMVFDIDRHPDLTPFKNVKTTLGHLSVGDVGVSRSWYTSPQSGGLLIAPNPNCPGSWYVDIRKPYWKSLMINVVIPSILQEGFSGILMDNLDIPLYLEKINPAGYKGMTAAAIDLVISIRQAFPNTPLMMNRAYEILESVGGYIDYALGSSVLTQFNTETQLYSYVPIKQYHRQVDYLQNAQTLFPNLVVLTLDFWNPADSFTINKIYNQERANGFIPYVGSSSLNQITPEP